MFDDTLHSPPGARNAGVLATMRAAMARLPLWGQGSAERARPCAAALPRADAAVWMSPPPERPLPRDLNLPLSAFDPGALRRALAPQAIAAAAFVDPVILEGMLHRIPAR